MTNTKELQVRGKQEITLPAEQTKLGLIFTPNVDIFETDTDITLLVDMPGVKSEDLSIDLRDNILSFSGEISPWENPDEEDILIEYEIGKYFRQFNLSEVIAQENIDAQLNDGVLRLTLPKVEKAIPRKITVKPG